MKVLSQEALSELLKQQISHVFCFALKITHSKLNNGTPYRIINDTVKHTLQESGGNYEYEAAPFEVVLPTVEEDTPPTVQCVVANISNDLIKMIRDTTTSPSVELYIVRIDTNGDAHIEVGPMEFSIINVSWDEGFVTFTLGFEYHYLNEPAMIWSFTPDIARGLFS